MPGHLTAIRRTQPSAPARFLRGRGLLNGRILDYGCGHGVDAEFMGAEGWDPHWRPAPAPKGPYDTIVCVYVLNVIDEPSQHAVLEDVSGLLADGGRVYFVVRRDLPKTGTAGKGCTQRWIELDLPVLYENKSFAIYEMAK